MAAAACIPIVNVLPANDGTVWQRVASAVLAALVVFAAGISKLFKFQETWVALSRHRREPRARTRALRRRR
jgi:hypothetical protein